MTQNITVYLKIRRFDLHENPKMEIMQVELNPNLDYNGLKKEVSSIFGLSENDDKVLKLRNKNYALIPLMNLLDGNTFENAFIVDVTKIQHSKVKGNANLQDAYLDAVRQKLHSMETRVTQAELLVPQLQWRRHAHMEKTVQNMSTRVAFLNRRIDELLPPQWKSKIPETVS